MSRLTAAIRGSRQSREYALLTPSVDEVDEMTQLFSSPSFDLSKSRAALLYDVFLMQLDMSMDGVVLQDLMPTMSSVAAIMAISITLPQISAWAFLWVHKVAGITMLMRMIAFPCLGLVAMLYMHITEEGNEDAWLAASLSLTVSLEPVYQLRQSWSNGKAKEELVWCSLAEGLIEAPCNCIITLYVLLLKMRMLGASTPSVFFAASASVGLLSIANNATKFHFYGLEPSMAEYISQCLFVKLPHVVSQILTYALFAIATRDPEAAMDENACWLVFVFVALECLLNYGEVKGAAPDVPSSIAWILSLTMVVGGPPSFLTFLDRFRVSHAMQHLAIAAVMLAIVVWGNHWSLTIGKLFDTVACRAMLLIWVLSSISAWATAACTALASQTLSLQARAAKAEKQLRASIVARDVIMCGLLVQVEGIKLELSHFVSCIPAGKQQGSCKWLGVCCYKGKLYFCPRNAADVMVLDPSTREVSFIPIWKEGGDKWFGICGHEGKLYFCPHNEADIMVMDPITGDFSLIPTRKQDGHKWCGLCVHDGKLYFCPCRGASIMVLDPSAGEVSFIPTGKEDGDWDGLCDYDGKLYFCPRHAADIMVLDPNTRGVSFIPTGRQGAWKWFGICCYDDRLYFCPFHAADIMVLDPKTRKVSFIPTGKHGGDKWDDICVHKGKLYFCPCRAADIMVLDPSTEEVSFIPTGNEGLYSLGNAREKPSSEHGGIHWDGICGYEGILYFCPGGAADIMMLDLAWPAAFDLMTHDVGEFA